ncbi:2-oxoglutarate (2OG) and Fe(II)-dependent oxygenase superfamily protein [Rhynchospora pubera]|uniref:2-oxoglutarate (2OG) and Fe(II)-dependent oxygenase superfamily protein n=1 Tax=Rhynchospora pubera TaxID=906938 RepID=A0AAV8FMY9_9POAL|nr:2-oxoglutarate (2OG) and Fe(II)-dependent oxygenase superfamily protein [Rhynchospora pubera]
MEAGGEERAEASLRIRHFHGTISPEEFATEIESKNIPAVFRGAVKGWNSISLWDPSNGGLDYMMEKVGPTAVVEAMMSNYEHIFNGDLRSHERVVLPFSAFIASCKSYLEQLSLLSVSSHMSNSARDKEICEETCSTSLDATDRLYLAQIPIYSVERKEHCSLQVLKEDIQTPAFIANKCISSINFWMNRARSRSSTHYDPHHNILCVVSGQKEVILWPPEACRFLYPMPIYGEASNHSAVSIEDPDLSVHARAKHMKEYSQKVILNVGDALFIPEGWFHQVDSSDLTVAVNFWWVSSIMSDMVDHMDAYYLRRILNRLVSKEMDRMLPKRSSLSLNKEENSQDDESSESCEESDNNSKSTKVGLNGDKRTILGQLEPSGLQLLGKLISLVHENLEYIGQCQYTPTGSNDESSETSNQPKHIPNGDDAPLSVDDTLAQMFSSLEPLALQKILLVIAECFPRTLEALILHMLGPAAAEVLTRKFDEMEPLFTKEQQEEFYKKFYSVFDDPAAAMNAILNAKETYAFQAFQNVLDQYVGAQVKRLA